MHHQRKMPPKKNAKDSVTKSENSVKNSAPNEPDSKKAPMKKEVSSRTLRPRKPAPVGAVQTKPKQAGKVKPKKESNHIAKEPAKSKRAKAENKSEDEPEAKLSKIESEQSDDEPVTASSIYEFKATTIQGQEVSLNKYKGHVCIITNVASKCGHTASNYKELVELHDKYSDDKGLRILAFPCNQFGKQEPGDNDKICEFAKKKNVNFDMFEKIDVNGKNAHPLWKYLTSQKYGPKGAKIDWNFTKFLIDKDGQVVERFKSAVKPLALVKDLEKLW